MSHEDVEHEALLNRNVADLVPTNIVSNSFEKFVTFHQVKSKKIVQLKSLKKFKAN